jgi:hypothetical protein
MDANQNLLSVEEALIIAGTGARPISFAASPNDITWGIGSAFLLSYNGHVFAVTAKHVIENQRAKPTHTRIFMPNTNVALPIKSAFTPKFFDHENKDEIEDLLFFVIDDSLFCEVSGIELYSWNLSRWWYPPSKLNIGDELLLAGFPGDDKVYDYDNNKLTDLLLLRTANYTDSEWGDGLHTMTGSASEYTFNGLSGAPVFCRKEGFVFFVGIITRGSESSGKCHFIGADIIISALNNYFKGLNQTSL